MATENKSSLNNILQAVLSVANDSQNIFYSPKIYSDQRNVVESLLLSALVAKYPEDQTVIDQISPFVEVQTLSNIDGFIELPDNYRNLLGSPMVFANQKSTGECNEDIQPLTKHTFKVGQLKSGCRMNPVVIVAQSEFAYRTQSSYDYPTWENPIGYFTSSKDGKNRIKVCPYDISKVVVMYVRKEGLVRYGYKIQPDDTYLYDEATTVETEFDSAAFDSIFKACMALYSAYAKDQELTSWAALLNQKGIF